MGISVTTRMNPPAKNPLNALQQKARRQGCHVLRARNFRAYQGTPADALGHVLIYDFGGRLLAGPFDLDAADRWLATSKLTRAFGGKVS